MYQIVPVCIRIQEYQFAIFINRVLCNYRFNGFYFCDIQSSIATTNTELIVNAVILLFVTELDEKVHIVIRDVNLKWCKSIMDEVQNVADNHGRGLLYQTKNRMSRWLSSDGEDLTLE